MLRLRRLFVCLSQAINVVLAGGRPNEMLSAKLYRVRELGDGWKQRTSCIACKALNWLFWEADHCKSAWAMHVQRTSETYWHSRDALRRMKLRKKRQWPGFT